MRQSLLTEEDPLSVPKISRISTPQPRSQGFPLENGKSPGDEAADSSEGYCRLLFLTHSIVLLFKVR